jgi:1,2-diacylglycerol 3-beta-galactosyltransferase
MRVLITTADTGGGHRAMSRAIAGAIHRRYPSAEISTEDVFGLPPRTALERATQLYGPCIRVTPWLYGWLYHLSNRADASRLMARAQDAADRKLALLIERSRPDVVVNTHPLANRSLVRAIEMVGRPIPIFASVSELMSVHRSWVEPGLALLNTATTESYRAVRAQGADARRVRCVGLPVDERFAMVEARPAELRSGLGLDPDRFTVLLVGGGEGAGGIEVIARSIDRAGLPLQLVVVCGRNEAMQARLAHGPLRTPARVFGFVKTMPELMRASDLVVTKGGPQTIAEALVASRPVILTQTLPGQEEGNDAFVESRGVGFAPTSVEDIVRHLARLSSDPTERTWLARNAIRHGRPAAAGHVAEMVVRLAGGP